MIADQLNSWDAQAERDRLHADTCRLRDELEDAGGHLRRLQSRYSDVLAAAARLERVGTSSFVQRPFDPDELLAEIRQLPNVSRVYASFEGLCLIVEATFERFGTFYDLGDWRLWIDAYRPRRLQSRRLRSGIKPSWGNTHPNYKIPWSDEYCFGDSHDRINELMEAGNIAEALSVAVYAINGVNERDIGCVHSAFERRTCPPTTSVAMASSTLKPSDSRST